MTKSLAYSAFLIVTSLFILITAGIGGLIIYTILMGITFAALSFYTGKDRTVHE